MVSKVDKQAGRIARHARVRKKVEGTPERPRFSVFRSVTGIYVQVIDDKSQKTLCACSTAEKAIKKEIKGKTKSEAAKIVGAEAAKRALKAGVTEVVFDRGGFLYTGRVLNAATGAREAGLKF